MSDPLHELDIKAIAIEFLRHPIMEFVLAPLREALQPYFPNTDKDGLNWILFLVHIPLGFLLLSILYFGVFARLEAPKKKQTPAASSASSSNVAAPAGSSSVHVVDAAAGVNLAAAPKVEATSSPPSSLSTPAAPAATDSTAGEVSAPTVARGRGRPAKASASVKVEPVEVEAESESSISRPRRKRRETQHFSPSRPASEETTPAPSSAVAPAKTKPAAKKRTAKTK